MARLQPTTGKAFKGYLRQFEGRSRDLFEIEEQLKELSETPGWGVLMDMLGAGRENLMSSLTESKVLEHAEYARQTGYIAGIEEAANAVHAVLGAAEAARQKLQAEGEAARSAREEQDSESVPLPH